MSERLYGIQKAVFVYMYIYIKLFTCARALILWDICIYIYIYIYIYIIKVLYIYIQYKGFSVDVSMRKMLYRINIIRQFAYENIFSRNQFRILYDLFILSTPDVFPPDRMHVLRMHTVFDLH